MKKKKSLTNLSSISNISKIPKDRAYNSNDEDSILEYEALISNTRSRNTKKIRELSTKNSGVVTKKKMPTLLKMKDKAQSSKKVPPHKYKFTNINTINNIQVKQIATFLSDQDVYQISEAQTEYMSLLDSIYKIKIQKMNEIHNKYDNELFKLKEYVDESNKENINNIIYNSVLKDKNEELKEIEEEFNSNIELALLEYNDKGERLKEAFNDEISNCVNYIKEDFFSKVKNNL